MSVEQPWLNPHLDLTVDWGRKAHISATSPSWQKRTPSDPTCPHWYDRARHERLIAGYLGHDRGRSKTVREFVSEFRGLSGTAKQAAVLNATGLARARLADLCAGGDFDREKIAALLAAMQCQTKAVKPKLLGLIGREHLQNRMREAGVEMEFFDYSRTFETDDGLPCVVEFAFGWIPRATSRRLIAGVNWSPGITNPFRQLGSYGESLDTILAQQRADRGDPVVIVLHVACPRVEYTDRGKSAIAIGGHPADDDDDDLDLASSKADEDHDRFLQEPGRPPNEPPESDHQGGHPGHRKVGETTQG